MNSKVHLVHLSDRPGGIEVLLPEIVASIPEIRFDAFVIRKEDGGFSVYRNSDIEVHYGSNRNVMAWIRLFMFVRSRRSDLFHVFNIGPVFLLILKMAGAKNIVYSIHGTRYWKNAFQKVIYQVLWHLALTPDIQLIANSAFSGSVFTDLFGPHSRLKLLYNPIDERRFFPVATSSNIPGIKVIYCGRLEEGKNLFTWIDVAVEVHKAIPHTSFALFGEGSLKELLAEKISALDADGFIKLEGLAANMPEVYRSADLLLFLSEYESFGNVVVESILSGTPVLVFPIPAMREIFSEFPVFLLNDTEDIAPVVAERIRHLDELKQETQKAIPAFQSRFSAARHMAALSNIYRHAANSIA